MIHAHAYRHVLSAMSALIDFDTFAGCHQVFSSSANASASVLAALERFGWQYKVCTNPEGGRGGKGCTGYAIIAQVLVVALWWVSRW